jgi:hypothetical protein
MEKKRSHGKGAPKDPEAILRELPFWEARSEAQRDADMALSEVRVSGPHSSDVAPSFDDVPLVIPREITDAMRDSRDDSRNLWQ